MNSKNKNKNKTKQPGSNQMSSGSAPTKRGRAKKRAASPMFSGVPALPSIFRGVGDVNAVRLKTSYSLVNRTTGLANYLLAVAPISITTPGYIGLANIFPILTGMAAQYSRFMVGRVALQLVPVTAATAGGYVALNYEPSDSTLASPPTLLSDVASAVHSDIAQVTEIAAISFDASDYYNDWRQVSDVSGAAQSLSQAGVIQLWGANTGVAGDIAAIFQIEIDVHFCGFRRG
jgi:hypothetical protein